MRIKNTVLSVVLWIDILIFSNCSSNDQVYYTAWGTISGKITERKSGKVIEFKSTKLLRYDEYNFIKVDEGVEVKTYIYGQYIWKHSDLVFTLR